MLAAYRYQPNLERRHHLLKSVQNAAPVLLKNPARIEGLFCCQFLALLVAALIEREVRTGMRAAALDNIPLTPSSVTAQPPPPSGSWRSSQPSPATNYTATVVAHAEENRQVTSMFFGRRGLRCGLPISGRWTRRWLPSRHCCAPWASPKPGGWTRRE